MSMKVISLLLVLFLPMALRAQKEVRHYYDPQKQKIREVYQVGPDNETYVGKYRSFYENGNVMIEGNFEDGEKSGPFTEYHENGTVARKLNYVNGVRHGAVEVYDEQGKSIQNAWYENDILKDSIRMYYAS